MYAIEIDNLSKSYDTVQVLRNLSLRVSEGEVYGLLGPNGAGKSTLIHLLLGFLKPSGGRVRVLGTGNLESVRGRVGYLPERLRYHTRYSAREYLRFLGQFSDMDGSMLDDRLDEELARVGLDDVADRPLSTFSKGMLQRVGIAQALLDNPDLLLIDEPTSGLDPAGQRDVMDLLAEIRAQGRTILLCTHYLDEIERLCDRVGVLVEGRLVQEAEVPHLRAPGTSVAIQVDRLPMDLQMRLSRISPAVQCREHTIILRPNNQPLQATILRILLDEGVAILALEPMERPLERLYLQAVRSASIALPEVPAPPATATGPAVPEAPEGTDEVASPPARRSGAGDTLLNELLRRDGRADKNISIVEKDDTSTDA